MTGLKELLPVKCAVPGCNKPKCAGYSSCCWGHARMTLAYNGFKPSKQDILEWCGPKPGKT